MDIRNVCDPLGIGAVCHEVAVEQILVFMYLLPHIFVLLEAAYLREHTILVHYPQYRLRIEIQGLFPHKPYLDSTVAVSLSAAMLALRDHPSQDRIPLTAIPAFQIIIVSTSGYAKELAHNRYWILRPAAINHFIFE